MSNKKNVVARHAPACGPFYPSENSMAALRIFATALLVVRCVALLAFSSAGAEIADSKFGHISARREFPGFAVVFEVYLLRIPTVYNLAMDDVMHIPCKLRVENSTLTDARVPIPQPDALHRWKSWDGN